MALFNLPSDLTKVELALGRIADALERAYPPTGNPRSRYVRGPEAIVDISAESVEKRRKLDEFLTSQGLSEAEREEEKKKIEELPEAVKQSLLRSIQEDL